MYCGKCGSEVSEGNSFCEKCGNKLSEELKQETISNVNSDEILLEIKPTTKMGHYIIPKLLGVTMCMMPVIFFIIVMVLTDGFAEGAEEVPLLMSAFVGGGLLLWYIIILISAFVNRKQNENKVYTFYPDRVVCKDSFLDKSQKELKYKYIREISSRQSVMQRFFKIGDVKLSSNAEGYSSGLVVQNIEEVDKHYQAIKEIIKV